MKTSTKTRLSLPVSALSLMLVVWIWHADRENTSPGNLSAVHAQDPRLIGTENCSRCHGSSPREMTQSCLACHEEITSQLKGGHGLHGRMPLEDALRCESCHLEHHGNEFHLVDARAFALAGIAEASEFDHAGLDFGLTGRHTTIGCEKCHPNARVNPLPAGQTRFLGLTNNCTSCHNDIHRGEYGPDCASCHGQEHPFPAVAGFSHPDVFPLSGVHAQAKCSACHPKGTLKDHESPDALHHVTVTRPARECADCHDSPHRQDFLDRVSVAIGRDPGQSCEHCHDITRRSFRGADAEMDVSLHALTGFPLSAPHHRVDCQACHTKPQFSLPEFEAFRAAYPGRSANDCGSCHPDPHREDFAGSPLADLSCLHCHQATSFHPSTLTADRHNETGYQLSAVHQVVACEKCHPQTVAAASAGGQVMPVRQFSGSPTSCRGCHSDPHLGQFLVGLFRNQDCSACHDENQFVPAQFTLAQHSQTRFPLTGAHEAVACRDCHSQQLVQTSEGNEPVPCRVFHGTPSDCRSCHADVHRGAFDSVELPTEVNGRTDCLRCHTTERFDILTDGPFDHEFWTGYPLGGAHAEVRCSQCHPRSRKPDQLGRAFGRARGRDCRSCHQDPHLGQFGGPEEVDCARCHKTTDSFDRLAFNHQTDSRFTLDRTHARLDCSACHRSYKLKDGGSVVRYKPLGTRCGDCHSAGQVRSQRKTTPARAGSARVGAQP